MTTEQQLRETITRLEVQQAEMETALNQLQEVVQLLQASHQRLVENS